MEQTYEVALEVFEGPLDLLLHLIKKNEIDIYDIPIVDITEQYNGYLAHMKELNLNIAGDFLLMASTLIHIKSKALLPKQTNEEGEEEDPREELVRQLLEYQLFKEIAGTFHEMRIVKQASFPRGLASRSIYMDDEDQMVEADIMDLIISYQAIMERRAADPKDLEFESIKVTLADQIYFILSELNLFKTMTLNDIFGKYEEKIYWIVSFLALLELIRLKFIKVYQDKIFGTIRLVRTFEFMEDDAISEVCRQFGDR